MTLFVQCRWVVHFEENLQEPFVCHLVRLVEHSHYFGVVRLLVANVIIGWVLCVAAGVANDCLCHTFDMSVD